MAQTQPRQNYHAECEAGVNKQINMELYASYVYQSMVSCNCMCNLRSPIYANVLLWSGMTYARYLYKFWQSKIVTEPCCEVQG